MIGKILMVLGSAGFLLGFYEAQSAIEGSNKQIEAGLLIIIGLPLAVAGAFLWRASIKKCPACAEWIKKKATICKHCNSVVGGSQN